MNFIPYSSSTPPSLQAIGRAASAALARRAGIFGTLEWLWRGWSDNSGRQNVRVAILRFVCQFLVLLRFHSTRVSGSTSEGAASATTTAILKLTRGRRTCSVIVGSRTWVAENCGESFDAAALISCSLISVNFVGYGASFSFHECVIML